MRRLILATLVSISLTVTSAAVVFAQWPTTCVELNDIVENHLGNQGNVGIYQRTFGDQAEAACQNDHRDDVRSVFAWAIGTFTPSVVEPQPVSLDTNWVVQTFHDAITGDETRVTFVKNEGDGVVAVGCQVNTRKLNIYIEFGGYASFYSFSGPEQRAVIWRWNSEAVTHSANWLIGDDSSTLFVPESHKQAVARGLIASERVAFRAKTGSGDDEQATEIFSFTGAGISNHPVAYIFGVCGRAV